MGMHEPVRRYWIESLECRTLLTAITSNQLLSGSIVALGQFDTYTFDANLNDHVSLVVGSTGGSNFVPRITVTAPNGAVLAAGDTFDYSTAHLPVTGPYTVHVQDAGLNHLGTYNISLLRVPAAQAAEADSGTISTGQYKAGTLDVADQDIYTFNASVGDSISLAVGYTSGSNFAPRLQVFAPNGVRINPGGGSDFDAVDLGQAGTYYAVVVDAGDSHVGTYTISLVQTPAAQPVDADSGPIVSGKVYSGTTDVADQDVYTFQGNAGDNISLVVGSTGGSNYVPRFHIYAPNGALLNADLGSVYEASNLAQTGTYYVVVRDASDTHVGTYSMSLLRLPGVQAPDSDSGVIVDGQQRFGTIDVGDQDVYTFNANVGDSISLVVGRTSFGNFSPQLQVFAPNGVALNAQAIDFDGHDLAQAGTYYVTVRDSGDNHVGTYELSLIQTPGTPLMESDTRPIQSNQRLQGTLDIGDQDIYTFSATAGNSISMVVASTGGANFVPRVQIFGPNGQPINDQTNTIDIQDLPLTGTYYAVVRDASDSHTGTYVISFAQMPATQGTDVDADGGAISSGQSRTGAIDVGDLDVYTLSLNAGANSTIRTTALNGSNFVMRIDVYSPNGLLLGSTAGAPAVITITSAPATGTYYIVARDNADTHSGNYAISVDAALGTDTRAPQATAGRLDLDTAAQQVAFSINEAITNVPATSKVTFQNLTSPFTVPTASLAVNVNSANNEVDFTFPGYGNGILLDGNYHATLAAGSVTDTAGLTQASAFSFDFFIWAGDANHDRRVNALDFNALASNYGRPFAKYSMGDFNYDSVVNTADFTILAAKFNKTLAAPPAPVVDDAVVADANATPPDLFGAAVIADHKSFSLIE